MPTATIQERIPNPLYFHPPGTDSEVVEMPLLLPRRQVAALEVIARRNGLTTGQLIRRVISDLTIDSDFDTE